MATNEILRILYGGLTTISDFNYETLAAPPMNQILWHPNDIGDLRSIATSIRHAGNIKLKYELIDDLMKRRSMVRLAAGTNRLVYRHLEIPSIVMKIAVDSEGIKNNPDEFRCQHYIKPFCTKVFEVSQCGVAGIFERVERITSRYEFASIADDVYDLITNALIGKYVLEDIGTKFMYNYGIRPGFGPVILDFPYVYELDGAKMYCDQLLDDGTICGGEIDYDSGFNFLTCTKCGRLFRASDLSKPRKDSGIFVHANKKGALDMIVEARRGNEVIKTKEYKDVTQFMKTKKDLTKQKREKSKSKLPVAVGVYGRKTYKEALDEYNKKFHGQAEVKERANVGVYEKEYTGEDTSETVTRSQIQRENIPAGIVTATSSDVIVEGCYGDTPIKSDVPETVEDVAIENSHVVEKEDSHIVPEEAIVVDTETAEPEGSIPESELLPERSEDEHAHLENVVKLDEDVKLTPAFSFGDDEPELQQNTPPETHTVRPTPTRKRSQRYAGEFYTMKDK